MVLFMLVLSALFYDFLNGFVSGLVFGKVSLFVPHEKKRAKHFISFTECLALDVTAYLISSLKLDFYICIQMHKKTPLLMKGVFYAYK